ncbi:hypothetical protein [Gimesia aquarii]|nr:hypothetical protein [Gimesia aquarii]
MTSPEVERAILIAQLERNTKQLIHFCSDTNDNIKIGIRKNPLPYDTG